jgi:tetratricopeptide (TPR) repeat protein
MAPEQIQGKEVDHRADLFALGVVLYEMLTRHKPFQGENLTVVSHRIVYDQFTPPRDYAKELPPGLERILDRALEKDPTRRYQRAKDMVEDLRRMLAETSRDDLNETLSIATWGAGVAPPPGPAGGGATTAVSAASAASAASPEGTRPAASAATPSAPAKAPPPPKPPKPARGPRPPLSFKRVGLYAALGALILVLAVAALRLGVAWSGGKTVAVEAAEDAKAVRYRGLVQEGEALAKQFKYTEAIQAFSRALEIAPDDREKARITQRLQDLSVEYQSYIATLGRSGQIIAYLEEARNAYENERYSDAAKAANSVLALDAANADALKMKGDAEAAQARLRQQKARSAAGREQTPRPQVAGVTPVPEASPAPEEPVEATENQKSRLRISIQAEVPEVTLRIDGKDGRLFSKTFRGERSGLLRKAKPVNAADAIDVAAGMYKLQILVVPGGKAGQTEVLNANFPGGGSRSLQIRVTAAGVVSVNLD